jgi:hypothetical protein
MAHEQGGSDFDWVAAQASCNAEAMFRRLQAGVEQDVRRRNGLAGRDDGWRFEYHAEGDEFTVTRIVVSGVTGNEVTALVGFSRAGPRIHVRGDDVDVEFTAVVTLDVAGECRFVIGEAMYAEWEIRRMALDLLFFEDTESR